MLRPSASQTYPYPFIPLPLNITPYCPTAFHETAGVRSERRDPLADGRDILASQYMIRIDGVGVDARAAGAQ